MHALKIDKDTLGFWNTSSYFVSRDFSINWQKSIVLRTLSFPNAGFWRQQKAKHNPKILLSMYNLRICVKFFSSFGTGVTIKKFMCFIRHSLKNCWQHFINTLQNICFKLGDLHKLSASLKKFRIRDTLSMSACTVSSANTKKRRKSCALWTDTEWNYDQVLWIHQNVKTFGQQYCCAARFFLTLYLYFRLL